MGYTFLSWAHAAVLALGREEMLESFAHTSLLRVLLCKHRWQMDLCLEEDISVQLSRHASHPKDGELSPVWGPCYCPEPLLLRQTDPIFPLLVQDR